MGEQPLQQRCTRHVRDSILQTVRQAVCYVADDFLRSGQRLEQEIQSGYSAFGVDRIQPAEGRQIEQATAAGHQVWRDRRRGRWMGGVAPLHVQPQPVAQALAVAQPGLDYQVNEVLEQLLVAMDEACIKKARGCRPRAASLSGTFGDGPHARLQSDRLFPERVAHGLSYPGERELAGVQEQNVSLGARRQLASAEGAECHDGDPARQAADRLVEEGVEAIGALPRGDNASAI